MHSISYIRDRMDYIQETLENVKKGKNVVSFILTEQDRELTELECMIQENICEYRQKKVNITGKFLCKLRTRVINNKLFLLNAFMYEIRCMKKDIELYMPKTP